MLTSDTGWAAYCVDPNCRGDKLLLWESFQEIYPLLSLNDSVLRVMIYSRGGGE
jgi:hypothetical protein